MTRTYSKVWSLAALRLGFCVAPPWVVAELEKVVLPYHLDVEHAARGHDRAAVPVRDGRAGRVPRRGARAAARGAATSSTASPSSRPARTSCCSGSPGRAVTTTRPRGLAGTGRARGARAGLLALARRRGLPAGHGRDRGGEHGLPVGPDATSCASDGRPMTVARHDHEHRVTKETDVEVDLVLDGVGQGVGVHRDPVLRPHARAARQARRLRPRRSRRPATSRSTLHHTVEDVGIVLGTALKKALGDKAGVRRFASGLVPARRGAGAGRASISPAGRSSSTRSTRSRSGSARSTRSSPRSSGAASRSRPASRCTCGRCRARTVTT